MPESAGCLYRGLGWLYVHGFVLRIAKAEAYLTVRHPGSTPRFVQNRLMILAVCRDCRYSRKFDAMQDLEAILAAFGDDVSAGAPDQRVRKKVDASHLFTGNCYQRQTFAKNMTKSSRTVFELLLVHCLLGQ